MVTQSSYRSDRFSRSRRGAILVGVLACLLVGTVLTALTVQSALRGRREARLERQLLQTQLLCEAGVVRAVKSIAANPGYQGETWQPPIDGGQLNSAKVVIEVTSASPPADQTADQPTDQVDKKETQLKVSIVALLDSTTDSDGPMQRSHSFAVSIAKPASAASTEANSDQSSEANANSSSKTSDTSSVENSTENK